MCFDVILADTPAGPSTFDGVDIHADFAGEPAGVGSGGNGFPMLGSGNLAQLRGHGKRGWARLRLIGRQSLFFGFSLGANGGLEGEARAGLSGDVLYGLAGRLCGFGLRRASALQGEDHLADFDLLAFLYLYFVDDSADRGRNLDDGFVGFEFHHGLAFGNFGAGRDHQANEIALRNIFAKFLQAKFARRRGNPWSGCDVQRESSSFWVASVAGVAVAQKPTAPLACSAARLRESFFVWAAFFSGVLSGFFSGAELPLPSAVKITCPTLIFCALLNQNVFDGCR